MLLSPPAILCGTYIDHDTETHAKQHRASHCCERGALSPKIPSLSLCVVCAAEISQFSDAGKFQSSVYRERSSDEYSLRSLNGRISNLNFCVCGKLAYCAVEKSVFRENFPAKRKIGKVVNIGNTSQCVRITLCHTYMCYLSVHWSMLPA
jgi:hypothetical protein